MKFTGKLVIFVLLLCAAVGIRAQGSPGAGENDAVQPQMDRKAVTAVYGVTADDYLPEHTADDYISPKTRRAGSRPSFDLPDAFYFIGGPVFLLILLRVMVIFLNGFEEKRKEEENQVASEHFNPD